MIDQYLLGVDSNRLHKLISCIEPDGFINYATALNELYPTSDRTAASSNFRGFRRAISIAAKKASLDLKLNVDTYKKRDDAQRRCWFTGSETRRKMSSESTKAETDVIRSPQDSVVIQTNGADDSIKVFLSYAGKDKKLVDQFMDRFRAYLETHPKLTFSIWEDSQIPIGEKWHAEIQRQIEICHLGFFMISPDFLASPYIQEHELPKFIGSDQLTPEKKIIPIMIRKVLLNGSMDLRGLQDHQIFRYKQQAFIGSQGGNQKDAFCAALYTKITKLLKATADDPISAPSTAVHLIDRDEARLRRRAYHQKNIEDDFDYVEMDGAAISLDNMKIEALNQKLLRIDAMEFLMKWLRTKPFDQSHKKVPHEFQPYCVVLGELGIGKTTTCKGLVNTLLNEQEQGTRDMPEPFYLDLRHVSNLSHPDHNPYQKGRELTLVQIIDLCLRNNWVGGNLEPILTAETLIDLVRHQGALVIFDGLDEVLVHINEQAGERFTRELFRILPPVKAYQQPQPNVTPGRLLISCRTHYFPRTNMQNRWFTDDREPIRARDYRAILLLPFTDSQIRSYLENTFPNSSKSKIDSLWNLLKSIHNLLDLAKRPYTLWLISTQIPKIEQWKLQGRSIATVQLYEMFIEEWLGRDNPKHKIQAEHKKLIMTHLAAYLWKLGKRVWKIRHIEQWLLTFFHEHSDLKLHYSTDANGMLSEETKTLFKEDLRTATFIVREGNDTFRFAHSSIQEYFLARYLQIAMQEGNREAWKTNPSQETFDFLGEMLQALPEDEWQTARVLLETLRDTYVPHASENALRYGLKARQNRYPSVSLRGSQFPQADLQGWRFMGSLHLELDLSHSNFSGARLDASEWKHVNIQAANFRQATFYQQAVMQYCNAREADFSEAKMAGVLMYKMQLLHSQPPMIKTRQKTSNPVHHFPRVLQLIDCTDDYDWQAINAIDTLPAIAPPPPTPTTPPTPPPPTPPAPPTLVTPFSNAVSPYAMFGHSSEITACAFSHNDTFILSASDDHTLKIWDTHSGQCLYTLAEHQGVVRACAFSHNDAFILSASDDKTLKIWDTKSGRCLYTIAEHQHWVRACAFSHNDAFILSASDDHTLKIWDTKSGRCLHTLTLTLAEHQGVVRACAFSHNDAFILSASSDKTLKIWDTHSGQCLYTLAEHKDWVTACAFSHNDAFILSASDDHTLKIWDTHSGRCLYTLAEHQGWVNACAFSHNDAFILSASEDHTLKIWDTHSGRCLYTLAGHKSRVNACAFSHNDAFILSASDDKTLKIWDTHSGRCLYTLAGHKSSVTTCAFSHNDAFILSASLDHTLKIWDTHSGRCLYTLAGHKSSVTTCAFSHNDAFILSAYNDHTLKIWGAHSGRCQNAITLTLAEHQGLVSACAFSHNDAFILSASDDSTLKIWDTHSGRCLYTIAGHRRKVNACAFSHNDAFILSASDDYTLKIWDTHSGRCLYTLDEHKDWVRACAFSHNDAFILSASSDNTLKIWDTHSGRCLYTLAEHQGVVRACAFSHNDAFILSASSDNTLKIWDTHSGRCLYTLAEHQSHINACAFSHNDAFILSASSDKTLKIWDTHSGRCLYTLAEHKDWVRACAFSHNDAFILSASDDHTLKIWDTKSGRCLYTLAEHQDWVRACAFSHNDAFILSASSDNTLKIWDTHSGRCLQTMMELPSVNGKTQTAIWKDTHEGARYCFASDEAWRFIRYRDVLPSQSDRPAQPVILSPTLFGDIPLTANTSPVSKKDNG